MMNLEQRLLHLLGQKDVEILKLQMEIEGHNRTISRLRSQSESSQAGGGDEADELGENVTKS